MSDGNGYVTHVDDVEIPEEYLKEAFAYADGWQAGRDSVPKMPHPSNLEAQLSKQRAHNEHLDRANKALRGRLERARMEALAREGILAERMDKAEAERDALAKKVAELEGKLAKQRWTAADPVRVFIHGQKMTDNQVPAPAPPRPRLFTAEEKDDFVGGCDSGGIKVFPNEISRGWWTIAVNGQPIPEDAP